MAYQGTGIKTRDKQKSVSLRIFFCLQIRMLLIEEFPTGNFPKAKDVSEIEKKNLKINAIINRYGVNSYVLPY